MLDISMQVSAERAQALRSGLCSFCHRRREHWYCLRAKRVWNMHLKERDKKRTSQESLATFLQVQCFCRDPQSLI